MRLRALMPIVGHVQTASVPDRHEPGTGEMNDAFLFAELDRLGYDGFVGCEYNPKAGTVPGLSGSTPTGPPRPEPGMTLALGCIADDYTGASDLANTLSKAACARSRPSVPADDLALPEVDAVVVSLKSRSIPAPQAVAASREADAWLRARGAAHVLFKVCSTFDSTDAGNIGPVTDALREDAGEAIALVTPAFPETARAPSTRATCSSARCR